MKKQDLSNQTINKFGVISFGGGFLTCGLVAQKGAKVQVGKTDSIDLGGEQLVERVQQIALHNGMRKRGTG